MSKYLEDLLSAEKRAIDAKLCLHSKKEAPKVIFNDLVANPKQAKEYEQMIMKRPDRKFAGVVEYCFSGMRFKVRLEGENRYVSFSLLGVKTLQSDKNQPALMAFANEALTFAKDHLLQRDVMVEIFNADKRGTFYGTIQTPSKQDYSLKLISEGLAQIHTLGNEKRLPSNFSQLEEAEEQAKQKELGLWSKSLRLVSENKNQTTQATSRFSYLERITVEMTNVVDGS